MAMRNASRAAEQESWVGQAVLTPPPDRAPFVGSWLGAGDIDLCVNHDSVVTGCGADGFGGLSPLSVS